ncbi:MAG: hypothetical protein ABFD24_06150 [Anaerolineaceae bacterium]
MPKKNLASQGTETEQPKKKSSAIPLSKIGELRFRDKDGNIFYLDAQWQGQYILRPIKE